MTMPTLISAEEHTFVSAFLHRNAERLGIRTDYPKACGDERDDGVPVGVWDIARSVHVGGGTRCEGSGRERWWWLEVKQLRCKDPQMSAFIAIEKHVDRIASRD